jgi:hypothetical protein
MYEMGVGHVWEAPLEPSLEDRMCPEIPGKLDWI